MGTLLILEELVSKIFNDSDQTKDYILFGKQNWLVTPDMTYDVVFHCLPGLNTLKLAQEESEQGNSRLKESKQRNSKSEETKQENTTNYFLMPFLHYTYPEDEALSALAMHELNKSNPALKIFGMKTRVILKKEGEKYIVDKDQPLAVQFYEAFPIKGGSELIPKPLVYRIHENDLITQLTDGETVLKKIRTLRTEINNKYNI